MEEREKAGSTEGHLMSFPTSLSGVRGFYIPHDCTSTCRLWEKGRKYGGRPSHAKPDLCQGPLIVPRAFTILPQIITDPAVSS